MPISSKNEAAAPNHERLRSSPTTGLRNAHLSNPAMPAVAPLSQFINHLTLFPSPWWHKKSKHYVM